MRLRFKQQFAHQKQLQQQPGVSKYTYTCFKCLRDFNTLKLLWYHLKYRHHITSKTRTKITCGQLTCNKVYYNGYSYRRHLLRDHTQLNNAHVPLECHPDIVADQIQHAPLGEVAGDSDEELHENNENTRARTLEEIKEDIKSETEVLLANFKTARIPSSTVQGFLNASRAFIENVVSAIEEAAAPILSDVASEIIPSANNVEHFKSILNTAKDPIGSFGLFTEYQQRQYVSNKGTLVPPEDILVGHVHKACLNKSTGRTQQKQFEETFQYVPIAENLQVLLEQPGYMKCIVQEKFINGEDSVLESYRNGSYYKDLSNEPREDVFIDVLLYNDDFQTANPLGSKKDKGKVLGVYLSVICLPAKYRARLDNILLVALAESKFVSKYGINAVLEPIVQDLEQLYVSGLQVNVPGEFEGKVIPRLLQAVGDNLALNITLGFCASFSANFYCRFCKTRKCDAQTQVVEDENLVRTQLSIDADIQLQNVSQTGLQRSFALNNLSYFHVADNAAPDIMHDFLEGIIPIELKLIVKELISSNLLTLDELNGRIQSFSYGFVEKANKPSPIQATHLTNPFGASGQKATQMQCLVVFFPS